MNFDIHATRAALDEIIEMNDRNRKDYGDVTTTEIQRERDAWQEMINCVDNWHKVRIARAMRDLKHDLNATLADHQLTLGINFEAERVVDAERGEQS